MGDRGVAARCWLVVASVGLAACTSEAARQDGADSNPSISAAPTTAAPTTAASTTNAPTTTVRTAATTTTMGGVPFRAGDVGDVTIEGPITGGKGAVVMGSGSVDLATVGYVQEEYFVSGTASAYESAAPLSSDGNWSATPVQPAPFTTRIVVRRPADEVKFSGTVAVEWLNVSAGFDSSPDWTATHTELVRSGWAWVGVSAQQIGIIGREGSVVPLALQQADPERYAALSHPGDSYSYDMFSQAGAAVRTDFATLLGGAVPTRVVAIGESQSAFRLTTYVNAVAPLANVYDGYLIHSRGAVGAALSQDPLPVVTAPDPTFVRTDLTTPVFAFLSETDVFGQALGYRRARQPDSPGFRAWEVAGTAHADTYTLGIGDTDDGTGPADVALFATLSSPPSAIYGGIISCDLPFNAGPQTYVLRAAVAALDTWVRTGDAPPAMPPLEADAEGLPVTDESGNTRGGVRTPHVDAPIARLSGLGQSGAGFCGLFGTTTPFDSVTLAARYPDHAAFVAAWSAAVDAAVASGAVLAADAVMLRSVAESSSIGSTG